VPRSRDLAARRELVDSLPERVADLEARVAALESAQQPTPKKSTPKQAEK
jgi:BMFP domain-containing protein YqiC